MSTPLRHPAVAGQFYPDRPEKLLHEIQQYTGASAEKIRCIGCVVPHAGYVYSGQVAGAVYSRLELPRRFIILCPNHTGMGAPLSIMTEGAWLTPLGEARIDTPLATELKRILLLLSEDQEAHLREHAIEVQVPFLQALVKDFSFVPIAIGVSHFEVLNALGHALAKAVRNASDDVLIIASSDMNHYESDDVTRVKDRRAIDQLLALDPRGLYDVVREANISMCGYGPAVAMLTATRKLGAAKAELIRYATSGDVSGDKEMVVGYAGIAVY
jgi:AmmeMemoRadiSam system protein B